MKKLLSLFVPLMALFLTLAPQTARAQLNEYFTISGASNLQVKFVGSPGVDLKYSTNKSTWTPVSGSDQTVSIGSGTYYFKGDNPNGFSKDADNYVQFITTAGTLQGNIMSLINSTSFSTEYSTIPGDYCFYRLFYGCGISSASALKVPATTLADYCYAYMFCNCTSLTTYIELPASIAKDYCYYYMFYDCYKLYTYNSGYADQYNTNRYILPLEELASHCCERMFSWTTGGGENATMRHKNVEIMAASLKDRKNTEIENCLAYMFKYDGSTATSNYFIFYTTLHFTEWGGTGTTAATYNWWGGAYGTISSRIKFYINSALPNASGNKATTNTSSTVATNFPKNNSINTQTNAYLTFKVNGGTWESDGTYQQDIKRFVSSYYTAKTIPAAPYKAGYTFSGWYTAADGGSEVSEATILSQTTSQTYYAHYVLAASSTLTITPPEHGTLVVKDNGDNTISSGASLASGTTLTLTATPAAGYRFKGYTGDATSSTFTMQDADATIGVEFEEDLCDVTIASPSNGTLTATDGTNNYTSGTTYHFNRQTDAGKEITFTATPASHYTFSSWTDASSLLTNKTAAPYADGQVCTAKLTIGNSSPLTYTVGASFALSQYTITTSATNGTVTGGGTYAYGTVISLVPLGASHYTFLKWSDENTSNPRSVTVTGNASYTAVFEFNPSSVNSADAAATIYQAGTGAGGKTILYALPSVTVSGITYTPVDMGYGVAWADRNIGATNITDAGGYFYYGSTTPIYPGTAGSSSTYYSGIGSMSSGDNLPMSADAAYQIMGSNWRIPTSTEWNQLLNNGAYNNTTLSANFTAAQSYRTGNGTITSKTDPTKSITLPAAGVIRDYTYTQMSTYMCYWSSTLATTSSNGSAIPYHLYIYNGKTLASGSGNALAWHSLPIRAIYTPDYSTCTLTIRSGAYTYIYICEVGQKVTITATPNDGYVFSKWSEDNNTNAIRTFTVMEDATYTATFTEATTYSITFVDEDGETVLDGPKDVVEGVVPTYGGSAPTKAATVQYTYSFNGWSPALYAADKNQTYTATYSSTPQSYTLTWETDGDALTGEYTSGTVAYGTTIVAPATPTKTGYTFTGWTPDVAATMPAATTTYTAHWTAKTSTVTLNANGGTGSDQTVTATYDAAMPLTTTASAALVAPTAPAGKTFRGYYDTDASTGGTQYYTATLTSARTWDKETASVILYARWTDIETVNLYDGEAYKDTYETTLSTYAGQTVNVVLKDRTFPAGQWNTISLPFSLATIEETPLDGRLYTITDVRVDNTNGMQIFFDAEDHVIAGKPYLLWIDELISDMRFDGVVMTTFTAGEFTTPSGYVKFKANIPWQKLTLKSQIFINNNRLYFPNQTNGTKMRSFRGYFEIQDANGMVYSPERVRIVAHGKNGTTVEVKESDADDADLADDMEDSAVRKYIHHGILVIERNGVKYNAQGQVIVNN